MLQRQVMDTSDPRREGGLRGYFSRRGRRPLTEDIVVLGDRADYADEMPHWLSIGWFVGIVAALVVIVWWELKRYLDSEGSSPRSRLPKEIKRGSDAWD
jgi:hypothetical protein